MMRLVATSYFPVHGGDFFRRTVSSAGNFRSRYVALKRC